MWQVCLPTEAHGPLEPSTPRLSCPLASLMRPRCPWKRGVCARSHARRTRPGASGEAAHDTAGTPPSYSARTPRMDGSAVTFGSRGHRICRRPARRARTGLTRGPVRHRRGHRRGTDRAVEVPVSPLARLTYWTPSRRIGSSSAGHGCVWTRCTPARTGRAWGCGRPRQTLVKHGGARQHDGLDTTDSDTPGVVHHGLATRASGCGLPAAAPLSGGGGPLPPVRGADPGSPNAARRCQAPGRL